jgi:predicted RNA-binding protein
LTFRVAGFANAFHFPAADDLGMSGSVHGLIVATAWRYNRLMSLPIHVDAYSGHKVNERQREFVLDEQIYEIGRVLDEWYEPSATYFKVQSTEGKIYLLRYDGQEDVIDAAEWLRRR